MGKLKNFIFGESSLRQTLFKNSFWLTVSNVGSSLIKAVIVIYAARVLGAAEYGLFSYVLSIATLFAIFSDSGLNYLITIHLVRRDEEHPAYPSTLVILRIGLVLMAIGLTVAAGPLITKFPGAQELIPLIALLIAFDEIRILLSSITRAENRMDKEAFGYILTNALIVVLGLVGLRYSHTSLMLTLAYLGGSALGTIGLFLTVKKSVFAMLRPLRFSSSLARKIFMVAIPLGLANAMWTLMTNTDALVLGWFRTAGEIGYYAAAQRPIGILILIPQVLVGGSLTLLARLAKEGAGERLKHFIERLIAFSFAVVLPLALGGIILAPAIIQLLYGSGYAYATLSFQLLLVTLVITYPSSIVNNVVLAHKAQKIYTYAMVAGALGNLLLDFILIPPFGIAGSVVATIGALSIINGYMWYKAKRIQQFSTMLHLPRVVVATLCMGVLTFALHAGSVNLFANIIISAGAYLGILIALREPLLKDVKGLFRQ